MPVEYLTSYKAPFWQFNGHLQSIVPSLFRKIKFGYTKRERLELPDGDFVDLDWHVGQDSVFGERRLVVLNCGRRPYIPGAARAFRDACFDILA